MMYMPCTPIPVAYVPRRCASKDRTVTYTTLGVYCTYFDMDGRQRFTAVIDIDRNVSEGRLRQICNTVRKYLNTDIAMIVSTCKGYHIYVSDFWYNVTRLYHMLMRLSRHVPEMDMYQIKLGYIRSRLWQGWKIIRIGGKYGTRDMDIVYRNFKCVRDSCHRMWLECVHMMIMLQEFYDVEEIVNILKLKKVCFR